MRLTKRGIGFLSPFAWPFRSGSRWRIIQGRGTDGRATGTRHRDLPLGSARRGRGGEGPRDGNGSAAPDIVVTAGPKKRLANHDATLPRP